MLLALALLSLALRPMQFPEQSGLEEPATLEEAYAECIFTMCNFKGVHWVAASQDIDTPLIILGAPNTDREFARTLPDILAWSHKAEDMWKLISATPIVIGIASHDHMSQYQFQLVYDRRENIAWSYNRILEWVQGWRVPSPGVGLEEWQWCA